LAEFVPPKSTLKQPFVGFLFFIAKLRFLCYVQSRGIELA
jgi:hypothetical protein